MSENRQGLTIMVAFVAAVFIAATYIEATSLRGTLSTAFALACIGITVMLFFWFYEKREIEREAHDNFTPRQRAHLNRMRRYSQPAPDEFDVPAPH